MAEVYGTERPRRKRRGRRLLITFLVLLILLAALLAVADRVAVSYAERTIGDRVAEQLAAEQATAQQPDVTVEGVPFLTQVAAGKYEEVKIQLRDFSAPAENNQTIKMPTVDVRALDVSAPLDTVRTGNGEITVGTVTGVGTIAYADLAALIGREGLTVSEQGGRLVGTGPIEALGQTFQLSGAANLEVVDGVVRVRFSDVTAEGLPAVPLVQNLVDNYVKSLSYDLKVPALPLGMQVQKVEPRPEGLVVTFGANNVPLQSGGV